VALVKTDVTEESITSIIRVPRIDELVLVTADVFLNTLILVALMMEAIHSYETSVLTTVTLHHIQEDGALHSHRRESLKSYICIYSASNREHRNEIGEVTTFYDNFADLRFSRW
jgi:hypothetical protein